MLKIISHVLLALTLFNSAAIQEVTHGRDENTFATEELFAKGGIGIIVKELYIDLKSGKNELRLGGGNIWTGHAAPSSEVVIFFESKIWPQESLPEQFDLAKSIVISFEADRVRFFDFSRMSGGYYKRQKSH